MYEYNATIAKIVDGDTFDFDVDLGFHITHRIRVRLANYDAPEVRGVERAHGLIVKAACIDIFAQYPNVIVHTSKKGKYGRWIADVYVVKEDGAYLIEKLIEDKLLIN